MQTGHDDAERIRTTVGSWSKESITDNYITRYAYDGRIRMKVKERLNGAGQDPCSVAIRRIAADVPNKKARHE